MLTNVLILCPEEESREKIAASVRKAALRAGAFDYVPCPPDPASEA